MQGIMKISNKISTGRPIFLARSVKTNMLILSGRDYTPTCNSFNTQWWAPASFVVDFLTYLHLVGRFWNYLWWSGLLGLGILLGVHQLGRDLPFVTSWVVLVGMLTSFLLCSLLSAVTTHHALLLVEVVVLELVKMSLWHLDTPGVVEKMRESNLFHNRRSITKTTQ